MSKDQITEKLITKRREQESPYGLSWALLSLINFSDPLRLPKILKW